MNRLEDNSWLPTQCLTLKTVQLKWNLVFFDEATRIAGSKN